MPSPPDPGLDGNGKISKDMKMTAMPQIDAAVKLC